MKRILKWIGIAFLALVGIVGVALAYDSWRNQEVDVVGFECRFSNVAQKAGEPWLRPEFDTYLYSILRSRRADEDKFSELVYFEDTPEPKRVGDYSATIRTDPEIVSVYETKTDQSSYIIRLDRKSLELMYFQRPVKKEYPSPISFQRKWKELSGEVPQSMADMSSEEEFLSGEARVRIFNCRKVSIQELKTAAALRYKNRHEGNEF